MALIASISTTAATASARATQPMSFHATDEAVGRLGGSLVERSLAALGPRGLAADKLAVTLLVHDRPLRGTAPPGKPRGFSHRGDQPIYPCSVVKLFYLVAAQARLEAGFIAPHEELDRA